MGAPAAPEVSEVLEALEATLPEDAPAGHEAWQKVKFTDKRAGPYSYFYFGSQRFQTTLKSCLTEQALLRVTRACYVKFSEGQPKERVIEFRDQVYDRIKGIPPEKRRRLLEATGAALAAPPAAGAEESKTYATAEGARIADAIASVRRRSANAKASERRRRKRQKQERRLAAGFAVDGAGAERGVDDEPERVAKAKAKDKAKGEGEPGGGSAQPAGREDAPEGHEAWSKVRFAPSTNSVKLNLGTLKLNLAFQTTVIACGGSRDEAERVARLCWVKFAEGASRDEVVAYRQALYDALAQGARAGAAPARAAAGAGAHAGDEVADLEAAKRDLKAQGRLEGSLLVEGRSAERKNASINGLYARRAADQDGHGAYEKVGADAAARPRFLYYCREKSRWKIDCNIRAKRAASRT
ncbi:unnamed protein product [Prorocentrum cordatum]|uniref:BZIP domain-containing protein n=1 Tax=Prorocentrum cordatum TaxID=2364126 RepID=A0ABN9XGG1_9DINO|nr:unnamed protein product [Polarella glacialis]